MPSSVNRLGSIRRQIINLQQKRQKLATKKTPNKKTTNRKTNKDLIEKLVNLQKQEHEIINGIALKRAKTFERMIQRTKRNVNMQTGRPRNRQSNLNVILKTSYLVNRLIKLNTSRITTNKHLRNQINRIKKTWNNKSLPDRKRWLKSIENHETVLKNASKRMHQIFKQLVIEMKRYYMNNSKKTVNFTQKLAMKIFSMIANDDSFINTLRKDNNPVFKEYLKIRR